MKSKVILFVISTLIVMASCTKSKEAKLEGKWKKIEVTNVGIPQPTTFWEFKSGELIISQTAINDTMNVEVSRAKYNMGFNGENYTLNITQKISGADLNWVMADGKVKQLNNDFFKWFNKNGFYGEFTRVK